MCFLASKFSVKRAKINSLSPGQVKKLYCLLLPKYSSLQKSKNMLSSIKFRDRLQMTDGHPYRNLRENVVSPTAVLTTVILPTTVRLL